MGVIDATSKGFIAVRENFADVINLGMFHATLVNPEKLQPANPNITLALYPDGGKRVEKAMERTLDDLRLAEIIMEDDNLTYLLIGTHYQLRIHYAMPVRNIVEVSLLYAKQVNDIAADHRREWAEERQRKKDEKAGKTAALEEADGKKTGEEKKPKDSGEFLSGLTPGDKLKPVIVAVLYLGDQEWNGPLTLHEMLGTTDERILSRCVNLVVNLITPEMIVASGEHPESELWKSMYAIVAGRKQWKDLKELQNNRFFESMSNTAMRFINTVLGTNLPINESEEAGGHTNMCNAIKEYHEILERSQADNKKYESEITGYKSELKEKDQRIAMLEAALANAGISV